MSRLAGGHAAQVAFAAARDASASCGVVRWSVLLHIISLLAVAVAAITAPAAASVATLTATGRQCQRARRPALPSVGGDGGVLRAGDGYDVLDRMRSTVGDVTSKAHVRAM
jgi:hypothetical protein